MNGDIIQMNTSINHELLYINWMGLCDNFLLWQFEIFFYIWFIWCYNLCILNLYKYNHSRCTNLKKKTNHFLLRIIFCSLIFMLGKNSKPLITRERIQYKRTKPMGAITMKWANFDKRPNHKWTLCGHFDFFIERNFWNIFATCFF